MNLLLTGAFNYTKEQLSLLEQLGYNVTFIQDERLPLKINPSNIDVVVCNSLFLYNNIEEFKNLKKIQLTSAGFDRLPIDYIKCKEIEVFTAKNVYSIPMAEWVVLKILEIYKNSKQFYSNQEKKKWRKERNLFELTGKTATIVGFGSVGKEVAKRLAAFGVTIIGVGRRMTESKYLDEYLLIKDINFAIEKSDIIILSLPLNEKTINLINREKINLMKEDSVLINVARGGLIDEYELIKSLETGKFLGVALDVFKEEPLAKNELWDFKNVIITPHNSFVSDKTNNRLFELIYTNLKKMRSIKK